MNRNSVNSLKMSKASKIVFFLLITQTQKKFLLLQHLRQTSCTRSFSAFWSCANLVEEMNGGTDCVFDEGYHARWGQGPAWNGKASHVPTFWRGQATGAWYDGLLGHQPRWRTKRKVSFASKAACWTLFLINPRIISNSVQHAALAEGEGCLSVDKDVPGYVVRADRITISYQNEAGEHKKIRLKNYPAIVCQHEIDHLNGVLFYDHINMEHPFTIDPDAVIIK